jgi:hypothetical protein
MTPRACPGESATDTVSIRVSSWCPSAQVDVAISPALPGLTMRRTLNAPFVSLSTTSYCKLLSAASDLVAMSITT